MRRAGCFVGFAVPLLIYQQSENDKTNKMICAPSKDSDQPGHPPSLISLRCPLEEALGPGLPIEHTAKTQRVLRLI